MRFEVKDNNLGAGYDIESIEPGHTCKILNLNDSDVVGDNMVITSVQYMMYLWDVSNVKLDIMSVIHQTMALEFVYE